MTSDVAPGSAFPAMSESPTDSQARIERLRNETAEIVKRRQRGLPAYRGNSAPEPVGIERERIESLIEQAREAMRGGRFADALLRADTAIGLAASDELLSAEAWALAGEARLHQGNMQTARAAFSKALVANPAHVEARVGLCRAYRRIGQPERAIPIYVETLALVSDGERSALAGELAECYRQAGRPEMAIHVLRQEQSGMAAEVATFTQAILTPNDATGWLLLLAAVASVAYGALFGGVEGWRLVALAAGVFLLYAALQWLRQPRR